MEKQNNLKELLEKAIQECELTKKMLKGCLIVENRLASGCWNLGTKEKQKFLEMTIGVRLMNVKEFIEELKKFPQDLQVCSSDKVASGHAFMINSIGRYKNILFIGHCPDLKGCWIDKDSCKIEEVHDD